MDDCTENTSSTGFARDYHMDGELAATADGKITALSVNVVADHGAFDACAVPTKFPAGLFHICSGTCNTPAAFASVNGVNTNKAPGGVACRCSFRVTEAVYLVERMVDVLAQKLGFDKSEIRAKNFIKREQFPCTSATFTEVVGAGPRKCATSSAWACSTVARLASKPHRQRDRAHGHHRPGPRPGHQTTYAQIVATELGIPSEVIQVEEGDTSTARCGLGT